MIRTQMQLTEEQMVALRKLSAERNQSISDLIRQSVALFLEQSSARSREAKLQRARAAVGRFASGLSDVSDAHDRHLADTFSK